MMTENYKRRISLLEQEMERRKLDSFLVTSEINVQYLSGFLGHDSLILMTPKKRYFITDSRYIEEAQASVKGFEVKLVETSTYGLLTELIKKHACKKMGFESMNLPCEVAIRLKKMVGSVKLIGIKDVVERIRAVKDEREIELIRDSVRLTHDVLDGLVGLIVPGVSEKYLARRVAIEFIRRGASPSFEPVIASKENASKPHARPSDKKVTANGFVMIDIGCNLNSYCSDITRMMILGKVSDAFKNIYNIVNDARDIAFRMIRPGVKISELDHAVRGHIAKKGFGKNFGHALGHGVGMEVHEEPSISRLNDSELRPGMVFTVEPAIYIPKFGGVRIEDMVLVTRTGCDILTK